MIWLLKRLFGKRKKTRRFVANHKVADMKKKGWKVLVSDVGVNSELTLMEKTEV